MFAPLIGQEPSSIQLAVAGLATLGTFVVVTTGRRKRKRAPSATIDWAEPEQEAVSGVPLVRQLRSEHDALLIDHLPAKNGAGNWLNATVV